MARENRARVWWCAAASGAVLAASIAAAPAARAQDVRIEPQLSEPRSIDLQTAPEIPPMARPAGLVTNRPTMPMADYVAAKKAASAHQMPAPAKPGATAPPAASDVTLYTQVAGPNEAQTSGGNRFPPDGDIATSVEWMLQVSNDQVVMYNWNTNAFKQVNLNTLFANSNFLYFAPRVIHDPYWDRFLVVAAGCVICSGSITGSGFFIAVSQTGDPSGGWWQWNAVYSSGLFVDFPQLGMDIDAIIVTDNLFVYNQYAGPQLFTFDKAHLYNGIAQGMTVGYFGGGSCTMAPPYVLDPNPAAYVLSYCPGDTQVNIGSLTNSSRSNVHYNLSDNTVSVGFHGLPSDAQQPGTTYTLDTGDNRFENRSLQVGSRIINTATINDVNLPTPAFYTFDIGAIPHTLVGEREFFAAFHSNDWHPSIVANTVGATPNTPLGEIFVTWMSTDPTNNVNLQLRASGGLGDDPSIGSGIAVFTSPLPLTNQTDASGIHRSGDYTSVTTYPAAALGCQADEVGILTGEVAAATAGLWSTRVGIVKHC